MFRFTFGRSQYDFDLALFEIAKLSVQCQDKGGLSIYIKDSIAKGDISALIDVMERIVIASYKSKEKSAEEFRNSKAYDNLLAKLIFEEGFCTNFINAILPNGVNNGYIMEDNEMTWNDYLNMTTTGTASNTVTACSSRTNTIDANTYAKYVTNHYLDACCTSNNTEKKKEIKKPMKSESVKITKVEVLNDRVVMVRFSDGTFTKAICTKDDADAGKFDIDIGITICIMKKLLGEAEGKKKAYEKLIKSIHKMMNDQEKTKKEEEDAKLRAKARTARKAERRAKAAEEESKEFQKFITDAIRDALNSSNIVVGGDDLK